MKNAASESLIAAVAAAVADGTPVDWPAVYGSARSEAERQLLEELGCLRQIATAPAGVPETRGSAPERVERSDPQGTGRKWGALQLVECIGRGGFGEVFRAWDPRLERHVALKLLKAPPHQPAGDPSPIVIREASLLARIRHPNVVTVFGAERIDGVDGIWMELLTGSTLADRLRHEGCLPEPEALATGVEICRALVAVHEAGLIHRDLKAQNVICEPDGRVVLMDLGAGRTLQPGSGSFSDLTGTPMYLAPELFTGAAASEQSDLYSLGVLLYQTVSGKFPVPAATISELADGHAAGRSVRLPQVAPGVSSAFCDVVHRALDANPRQRFGSAAEMAAALLATAGTSHRLPFLAIAVLLMAAVVGLAALTYSAGGQRSAEPTMPGPILIGEFENRTGRPELDGAVQALLKRDLASRSWMAIAGEERIQDALKLMKRPVGQPLDRATAREVAARDGGIRTYVTGSIEARGNGYTIAARIGTVEGAERVLTQIIGASEDLARAVGRLSTAVRRQLGDDSPGITSRPREAPEQVTTPSLTALRLYSAALRASARSDDQAALELARQATIEDPTFASAHAWVAWCEMVLGRPDAAAAAVRRAVEFSNGASEAERLFILALSRDVAGQGAEARAAYRALVDISPDHFWAVTRLVVLSGPLSTQAVELTVRAADLRPANYDANRTAAIALQSVGDLDRAGHYVRRARDIGTAENLRANGWLTLFPAFEMWTDGRVKEAAQLVDAGISNNQTNASILLFAAEFNIALGRLRAAERAAARLLKPGAAAFQSALGTWLRGGAVPPAPTPGPEGFLPQLPSWVWLLARSGRPEEARALVETQRAVLRNSPGLAAMEGMLLNATGDSAHAATSLDAAWRRMPPGIFLTLATADEAALAFARIGDLARSCEILADATRDRRASYGMSASMLAWLNARVQLAECYDKVGMAAAAEEVSQELRPLLAVADADFEPALRLRRVAR